MTRPNLFGSVRDANPQRGGGILPSIRPHYHPKIAKALHDLAESNPSPRTYALERARILEGHQ